MAVGDSEPELAPGSRPAGTIDCACRNDDTEERSEHFKIDIEQLRTYKQCCSIEHIPQRWMVGNGETLE
jgi:hypothetical protein